MDGKAKRRTAVKLAGVETCFRVDEEDECTPEKNYMKLMYWLGDPLLILIGQTNNLKWHNFVIQARDSYIPADNPYPGAFYRKINA